MCLMAPKLHVRGRRGREGIYKNEKGRQGKEKGEEEIEKARRRKSTKYHHQKCANKKK